MLGKPVKGQEDGCHIEEGAEPWKQYLSEKGDNKSPAPFSECTAPSAVHQQNHNSKAHTCCGFPVCQAAVRDLCPISTLQVACTLGALGGWTGPCPAQREALVC